MAATMQRYVDEFERVPVLVLPCLVRYREPTPFEGASIYPACQNLLLAARALGYGGVLTGLARTASRRELRELLGIPEDVFMAATITHRQARGWPRPGAAAAARRAGLRRGVGRDARRGPSTRSGTKHTQAGPPKTAPTN